MQKAAPLTDSVARIEWAAVALAAVAAVVSVVIALLVVRAGYVDAPFWDQWRYVADGSLWAQPLHHHNEHQILAARVFYTIDGWLGGRQLFDIGAILAIQLGVAVVLALLAQAAGAGRRP